jgi:hypothetical protein
MTGGERSRVLAVNSIDPVMSLLSAVGLAAARGSALLIDTGNHLARGGRTLADLADDGPRLDELSPGRSGVAVLGSGQLPASDIRVVAEHLATRWPGVVIRVWRLDWEGPTVPVVPLYPGVMAFEHAGAAVWQPLPSGPPARGPGPVLPRLPAALVRRVLRGGHPGNGRWVRAWQQAWELPWA